MQIISAYKYAKDNNINYRMLLGLIKHFGLKPIYEEGKRRLFELSDLEKLKNDLSIKNNIQWLMKLCSFCYIGIVNRS